MSDKDKEQTPREVLEEQLEYLHAENQRFRSALELISDMGYQSRVYGTRAEAVAFSDQLTDFARVGLSINVAKRRNDE